MLMAFVPVPIHVTKKIRMASGYGALGGVGRCHSLFVDYEACSNNPSAPRLQCQAFHADYFECLHNKKEVCRLFVKCALTASASKKPRISRSQAQETVARKRE